MAVWNADSQAAPRSSASYAQSWDQCRSAAQSRAGSGPQCSMRGEPARTDPQASSHPPGSDLKAERYERDGILLRRSRLPHPAGPVRDLLSADLNLTKACPSVRHSALIASVGLAPVERSKAVRQICKENHRFTYNRFVPC